MIVEIIKLPCKHQQYITDFYYALSVDGMILRTPERQYPRDAEGYPDNEAMLQKLQDIKYWFE